MSKKPYTLARYQSRAERLLQQPKRLLQLGADAQVKLDQEGAGRLAQVREQLGLMLALLRSWVAGDYRGVSTSALLSVAAAVAYFVNPFDAIPDFLLGLGLIDDVAVIGFVIKQVQEELEKFRQWQTQDDTAPRNCSDEP